MNGMTYVRLFFVSLLAALILSGLSLFTLSRVFDLAAREHRDGLLIFLSESIEWQIHGRTLDDIREHKIEVPRPGHAGRGPEPGGARPPFMQLPPPPPPMTMPNLFGGPPPGFPPEPNFRGVRPPRMPFPGSARTSTWVLSESGEVLSHDDRAFPVEWESLPKPANIHQIAAKEDFFRWHPSFYVVRLDHDPALYFVFREDRQFLWSPLFYTQAAFTFGTVAAALFLALSITFFYLRKKSVEARVVLSRLEKGDLKARFEIHRIDEFSGLMLDFNRMAEEIDRLVTRVRSTEEARRELLQELGHDLRTPLTSLQTSFENLKFHSDRMSPEQRGEVIGMITREIDYFKDLLEKILTLGSLDEPSYRGSTESIDLVKLLQEEIAQRQSATERLQWRLENEAGATSVTGDLHLVKRLFKNAFDNAGRFARREVRVRLLPDDGAVAIHVIDDGPGLSETDLNLYGKRRDQRSRTKRTDAHFSLGLGSVIMKTIADLHGGSLDIRNIESQGGIRGAEVIIRLATVEDKSKS